MYQPKTGAKCYCRRGIERDNCSNCEGTGMVVDFAAIRARHTKAEDGTSGQDRDSYTDTQDRDSYTVTN